MPATAARSTARPVQAAARPPCVPIRPPSCSGTTSTRRRRCMRCLARRSWRPRCPSLPPRCCWAWVWRRWPGGACRAATERGFLRRRAFLECARCTPPRPPSSASAASTSTASCACSPRRCRVRPTPARRMKRPEASCATWPRTWPGWGCRWRWWAQWATTLAGACCWSRPHSSASTPMPSSGSAASPATATPPSSIRTAAWPSAWRPCPWSKASTAGPLKPVRRCGPRPPSWWPTAICRRTPGRPCSPRHAAAVCRWWAWRCPRPRWRDSRTAWTACIC
mmetsp:Transcript_2846/g.7378  ORF Transcript_2846/g.7378 Transcript_2846/m.7378 type:complete len:280 (+) Transcript_2846:397-1236(+)